ncbi:hypothetical protein ABEB36_008286 [Hypothenemus hampei]|uniref:Uncharacterized protein n=1 Tax=Hypothenemus hampei TaxID=57062 RepID=A0ABD1ELE7_HYPHA
MCSGQYTVLCVKKQGKSEVTYKIGFVARKFVENADQKRMERQGRRSLLDVSSKEIRTVRREAMIEANLFYEESKGLLYGPGTAE